MEITLGSRVFTREGDEIGSIDKLIVDPATGAIQAAVVRQGRTARDDLQLPVRNFAQQTSEGIRLNCSRSALDSLPEFDEGRYQPPPEDFVSPTGHAISGLLMPLHWSESSAAGPPSRYSTDPVERELAAGQRPQGMGIVEIGVGSDVRSRDGKKVGEVQEVGYDATTGKPSHFVVRRGFLFTEDRQLPADTIATVEDGVVYLELSSADAESYLER